MSPLPRWVQVLDRWVDALGRALRWLVLAMTLVGAYQALARYLGRPLGVNLTSNAGNELQWYLYSALFLLGGAYALRHDAHVRVDVWYARLSPRRRAFVDLVALLLFVLPFAVLVIVLAWRPVAFAWAIGERSSDPGGLPRAPIKTLVPVAFALLALQALAEATRRWLVLRGRFTPEVTGPADEWREVEL